MSDQPKLAIVITCYNYENFVEHAIRSVTDQNRDDCELVVVDDGSTDDSWNSIQKFSGIKTFRTENKGQPKACLYGFSQTTAPFVMFLDADDELKPGSISRIIDHLDPGVAKIQFMLTRIDAGGNVIGEASYSSKSFRNRSDLTRQVLKTGVYRSPPTSGNVFRRDVCELLKDCSYDTAVDGVIVFAAPFLGDIVSIPEALGRYRVHDRNISGFGRKPDAKIIAKDIQHFEQRMDHLRTIIRPVAGSENLVDAEKTFYHQERSFFLSIATGQKPRVSALAKLLVKLVTQDFSLRNKAGMALFFTLTSVLPIARAQALLAYRLNVGQRSPMGFLHLIFKGA
ncbi:glycosyltransferase family 2 protein [Roseibium marinum]|uniref:Glycosyltransferase involved in cell wall biosynthesis n=1 Tax=Roseibium marinum TaxID=281252 RepID=A0A2S3UTM2_9HYPH|nr:glycosyltransferase family 2 protein [Roseibium marinum]POF31078.1 glycosyltransferase involved in cell wall biosynthesis [Roseibium marinum]